MPDDTSARARGRFDDEAETDARSFPEGTRL